MNIRGTKANKINRSTICPVTVIRPPHGLLPVNLREIWENRELLRVFTWRDIKVRYRQTLLGAAWAVIQPVFLMVVFTLFFGMLANMPSEGIPYAVYSYVAILPWTLFSTGLTRATTSVSGNANLVQKIYFPRLILPLSTIISPLVDFAIAFGVLVVLMLYFGLLPSIGILMLPLFLILALLTALGAGLWLAAINAKYRDIGHAVPFLVQFWFFASPVVYSSTLLPERFQILYGLNPMVGVIEGFRWALLGTSPPGPMIAVSVLVVLLILISGAYYFRYTEKTFADVV